MRRTTTIVLGARFCQYEDAAPTSSIRTAATRPCAARTKNRTLFGASDSNPVSLLSIEGDVYRRQ
jgi:hypothetical protein